MIPFIQLSDDIDAYYKETRPSSEIIESKEQLITYIAQTTEYLHESLKDEIKADNYSVKNERGHFLHNLKTKANKNPWSVFKFGSESWGTSCGDSDVDLAIFLNFPNSRFDKKFVLKCLARSLSEGDEVGQLAVKPLIHAKYPIIRIQHLQEKSIKVDISIADRFCSKRNELILNMIKHYETRYHLAVRKLIIFIKNWSKVRGINNSYYGYLNSFGFTLLILKFIQSIEAQGFLQYRRSVADLVSGFFEFYTLRYNLSKYAVEVVNPLAKFVKARWDPIYDSWRNSMSWNGRWPVVMQVLDPVNSANNVAVNMGAKQYQRMGDEFIRAYHIMRNSMTDGLAENETLFQLLTEDPIRRSQSPNWGPQCVYYAQPESEAANSESEIKDAETDSVSDHQTNAADHLDTEVESVSYAESHVESVSEEPMNPLPEGVVE